MKLGVLTNVYRNMPLAEALDRFDALGITAVEILSVSECSITVRGLDAIDGTPVLDIKPYFPVFDKRDAATPGWVDILMDHYF